MGVDYGLGLICAKDLNSVNYQILKGISLKLREDFMVIRLL